MSLTRLLVHGQGVQQKLVDNFPDEWNPHLSSMCKITRHKFSFLKLCHIWRCKIYPSTRKYLDSDSGICKGMSYSNKIMPNVKSCNEPQTVLQAKFSEEWMEKVPLIFFIEHSHNCAQRLQVTSPSVPISLYRSFSMDWVFTACGFLALRYPKLP